MVTGVLAIVVVAALVYLVDPTFFGLLKSKQGFQDDATDDFEDDSGDDTQGFSGSMATAVSNGTATPGQTANPGAANLVNNLMNPSVAQGFADLSSQEGPANFGSTGSPAGCYPRDQLTPSELLPKDKNSVWAEQNPMGPGSLKGKNFLSAGALIGVNTVGQSLRNANWQLRSEPPNPQVAVSIFNQSTIAPDTNRRPLEIN